ncbi:alpha/beta hydrolase [Marivita sp. S6314]|uniref:alpha/beta fold hydrolase n=1 Tax=Marivita sp. S6314 TaxID=2926406 RepID=UPI001FF5031C|nr:alpha/beta hydrolase [Marivita sp. S6314]MCK0150395.1 alpha/beta hydrolase [Marivita sp. S6314]
MYIDLPTARIFFDTAGPALDDRGNERPTLLMLHGGPGYDHTTLRPHFDRFADIAQVVYFDHRGCGRSGGTPDTWTLDQWADDVADLCRILGIEKPIVFGQSFGGMVAMRVAARHPDLASKLILSSTAAHFETEATVEMARTLGGDAAANAARALFTDPSLETYATYGKVCLPLYTRTAAPKGASFRDRAIEKPEVTVHFFKHEMMDMDMRPALAAVSCPTLVLAGALDPVTPVICSQDIANAIGTHARLEVFDDCGHGVHRDDPDRSEAVMREFILSAPRD